MAKVKRRRIVMAGRADAPPPGRGPTPHFDELDDPAEAELLLWEALGLTEIVIAPHVDNPDFGEGCRKAGDLCERDGFSVIRLTDRQALAIHRDDQRLVEG